MVDKFGKYLSPTPIDKFIPFEEFEECVEKELLKVFVGEMYDKIKEKELTGNGVDNESALDFCNILSRIISLMKPERFDGSLVMQPSGSRQQSLY
jgi:hypothetical protein